MIEDHVAETRRTLLEKRRALARASLGNRRSAPGQFAPITPRQDHGPAPLSFAQERLWFLDRWNPGSSAYNSPMTFRIHGALHLAALQASLQALIERHEVLRSCFPLVDGQPVQVIRDATSLSLPVVDLSDLPDHERLAEAERQVLAAIGTPFDLDTGPLIRPSVLRLGPEEHILIVILHHIVTDAWSRVVFTREFVALYQAFCEGLPNPLSPLPIQYADFAVWQRRALNDAALDRLLAYWRPKLAGAPALLELPADRARPAVQSDQGVRLGCTLPSELGERLDAIGKASHATLFMTLLASFQVLLYRVSGQDDLVVGTPIANRTRPEVEGLVGFFTNTLALRTDLSGDPSFVELLERVRETALGAYAHQDLPFEKLVEELQPERSLGHSSIFQVMFAFHRYEGEPQELSGLKIELMDVERTVAKFDVALSIVRTPWGLDVCLDYTTDLFDAARMQRLLGHFQTLLEGIVADPDQRISRLPLLTPSQRQHLLVGRNDTAAEVPGDRCVHHLFEEQVERTPDAVALEYRGRYLTYAQLNAQANRLARHLQEYGIGAEARVALCAERSVEMVVGVLGILKSGAAYVPIDPSYPSSRVALMCRDAQVALALTHGDVLDALAETQAPRLPLAQERSRFCAENLGVEVSPLCAAYVIYTSGSTGRPKGVVMIHGALVNLLYWHGRILARRTRTLQFASIGFDVSFQELFATWFCGGTVVGVDEEDRRDIPALLGLLGDLGIERLFVPVAVLQNLAAVSAGERVVAPALREVITAGEQLQLTPEIVALLRRLPGVELQNHYGPTEAHAATSLTLRGDVGGWPALPPIGTPITNARIYLLDRALQLVPEGVPGDLYVGGAGLGRGYLRHPEMTAERFVPDPFSSTPGARMYRTGDLVRYLTDGNLECLGRMDHQVKIRGFRVELGEIESVLLQHPRVREAVVVAREDVPGDRRLAAYVVGSDGGVSVGELRGFLREQLPGHLVPSAFVMLEALPLNSNGKVDRKALPTPDDTISDPEAGYVSPRTAVEEVLAEIWGRALRAERVGVHDNFFELGGHSLLATQVVARIRDVFHVGVPLRTLFENPTIVGLARKLASGTPGDKSVPDLPLHRVDRDRPLPLSFAQERLWFMDQLQPGNSLFNFPMALRLGGKLDIGALERAIEALQRRHEVLRTVFALRQTDPIQIILNSLVAPMSVVELDPLPEDEQVDAIERLVSEEVRRPFDLARGPIYRCHLIRLAPEEHVLVLTLHHIAADETSATVFLSELSELYRAELTGRPAEIPELPVQYADYAVWQRERFEQGLFQCQVDYWKRQLRNVPPFMEVPTDYPRPASPTFSRQSHRFTISKAAAGQVARLCREETATPFMFYLAVFQLLLSRWTGRQDILVGTDTLNRDRSETQALIGFFINQLVLRTNLAGCVSFRHLLQRVRSVALEGYANQELPFNKLVELLKPARDPERPPLYQVKLAYTKGASASFKLEGLSASGIQADKGTAQLDLTLFLREHPEGVFGRMEYRDELYRPATVTRLGQDYEQLVQLYSADPDRPLDAHEAVTAHGIPKPDAQERRLANRAKLLGMNTPNR